MPVSLMVCVPTFDRTIRSMCAESLGNAIEHADSRGLLESVVHRYQMGYDIARARNLMARWALDAGVDKLLMVDSDMVLPEDALSRMLDDDVDVCLGWYVRGTSDAETNMVRRGGSGFGDCFTASQLAGMSGLVRVRAGGLGCALVDVGVFRRFQRPWFEFRDFKDGRALSEDYDFCRKLEGVGVPVWVDADVACGHIHERVLEAR